MVALGGAASVTVSQHSHCFAPEAQSEFSPSLFCYVIFYILFYGRFYDKQKM